MTKKIRRLARARDKRADFQIEENIRQSDLPPKHSETHSAGGNDEITPNQIGAETPTGAQSKVDEHENKDNPHIESASNTDLDNHTSASNPHTGSQERQGGTTANRPSSPSNYEFYFDTDLNKPIWYNGTDWVDATGTTV